MIQIRGQSRLLSQNFRSTSIFLLASGIVFCGNELIQDRWTHIINKYLCEFQRLKEFIVKTEIDEFGAIGPFFTAGIKMVFAANWRLILTPELSQELEGIAEITSKFGLDYRTLLILNIGYDLVARCTSAVTHAPDGTPYLLRNMDWESPVLHSMTIEVNFMSAGKILYKVRLSIGARSV